MRKINNNFVGIFGGSFDPPHKGHLIISRASIKKLKLKNLYWIITKKNPLKKKTLFSLNQRLRRCAAMIKSDKKIKLLFLEKKVKSSRTIKILKYFIKKTPESKFFLIIGSDNLINFTKWTEWKLIAKLCKLVVFSRKGFDLKAKKSVIVKYLDKKNIIYIKNKKINISSTELREKILNKIN